MEREKLLVRISVPFCTGHCCYCERKTFGENVAYLQRYRRALERELEAAGEDLMESEVVSVHVEAESPSLFGIGAWDGFLRSLKERIPGSPQWVVNLMPQELTPEMVHVLLARQKIERVVLCLDALDKESLRALHRPYTENLAAHAISFLQKPEGEPLLSKLSVELFFGIPGQSPKAFLEGLKRVLALGPREICLRRFRNRTLSLEQQLRLAEETSWESYLAPATACLLEAGYEKGGPSGLSFAREGGWLYEESPEAAGYGVMGFGTGAVTCLEGVTYRNTYDMNLYLEHSGEPEIIAVFG